MFTKNPRFKAMLCTVPFAFGSAELMANEEDTNCEDWTLRQSGQWLSCTFQDQNIDRDLVNFFLEQSQEKTQKKSAEKKHPEKKDTHFISTLLLFPLAQQAEQLRHFATLIY
jgi:hypothetical protein